MNLPSGFHFIERGWLNSNSLLIDTGDQPVIIDTGHYLGIDETMELIRATGIAPESIGKIILTHGHIDHHGANRTIKELSGCRIIMSETTAAWFQNKAYHHLWFEQLQEMVTIVPADETVRHGQIIDLGGYLFEVIALPGHSDDTIGLYQPDLKLMVCADALWEHDFPVLHPAQHGMGCLDRAVQSIETITRYDVEIAIPGHGPIITDVPAALARAKRRLASFQENPQRMFWHLVRRFIMFNLLISQPISREAFVQQMLTEDWVHWYRSRCLTDTPQSESTSYQFLVNVIDEFRARHLVMEKAGIIHSMVAT